MSAPGPVRPPARHGLRASWLAFVVGLGVGMVAYGCAKAAEPARWVIWNETTDKPHEGKRGGVHRYSSATACSVDIAGAAKVTPDGSRLSCRRITPTKGE